MFDHETFIILFEIFNAGISVYDKNCENVAERLTTVST